MNRLPKAIFMVCFLVGGGLFLLSKAQPILSAATHIVISEIQVAGSGAYDEFVELYNPTDEDVDLEGWRLRRTSASGSTGSNLASTIYGTIPAHGFFLIAHQDYDGAANADLLYTATTSGIAVNNHVILYSDAGTTEIDRVGLGTASSPESSAIDNPATDGSVERKAVVDSTATTMGAGGAHETWGNGYDTDNNSNDFVERTLADAQNTTWPTESPGEEPTSTPTETPTSTPTEEPTATPTEEPSPTPTDEPSPTPTEEPSPTATPTEEPTVTPTEEPSPTPEPTEEPSPTPEPTTEPTPTVAPSPTPTPSDTFSFLNVTCTKHYIGFRFFGRVIYMPHAVCMPR